MGKVELRREILIRVKGQETRTKEEKDKRIKERFLELPEYKAADAIAFYVSYGGEVDTWALMEDALRLGKQVLVPVVIGDDLYMYGIRDPKEDLAVKGPFGIPQPDINDIRPFPKERINLIAVPGVAFSRGGARLGRGKGFYDRFLRSLPSQTRKVGLAYDLQIVDDLPAGPHDVPVDLVITN